MRRLGGGPSTGVPSPSDTGLAGPENERELRGMLLVHGSLAMGGVETLLVRLAREFSSRGVCVRVLLLLRAGDEGLLNELRCCATVRYLDEFVHLPTFGSERLALLAGFLPLKQDAVFALLEGIDHVHFTESLTMTLCARLLAAARRAMRVTGGVYYQYEYAYPDRGRRYFTSVMARQFAFHAGAGSMFFFSEAARQGLGATLGRDLSACPALPIGIDLKRARVRCSAAARRTKVVSVGRITSFKTYNLHFLAAVAQMRRRGMPLEYHIYGEGPATPEVRRRIDQLGLAAHVHLHGHLDYSRFPETIADAGLFVGSGTALIEAAACGVPALIGIELQPDDLSYGFLHEMTGLAYHEQGIDHPKAPFIDHVERLLSLDADDYRTVCEASVRKARTYAIEGLVDGWIALHRQLADRSGYGDAPRFNGLRHACSLVLDRLAVPFGRDSGFWSRYDPAAAQRVR
jgi:glycosyltransferase involved in cell wall biosynthesis